jgi:hypothetical protein
MYEIIVNLTCINRTSVYFELISWPLGGLIFNDFTVYAEEMTFNTLHQIMKTPKGFLME